MATYLEEHYHYDNNGLRNSAEVGRAYKNGDLVKNSSGYYEDVRTGDVYDDNGYRKS